MYSICIVYLIRNHRQRVITDLLGSQTIYSPRVSVCQNQSTSWSVVMRIAVIYKHQISPLSKSFCSVNSSKIHREINISTMSSTITSYYLLLGYWIGSNLMECPSVDGTQPCQPNLETWSWKNRLKDVSETFLRRLVTSGRGRCCCFLLLPCRV